MSVITDPLFYAFVIPAVIMLGLSKGGFSGIGMVATPLLALLLPPLEAAAILLPIILLQDAMSCWVYRRVWDPWNLKVMLPGAVIGVGAAWLFAAYMSDPVIRLAVGLIALGFALNSWLRSKRIEAVTNPKASHGVLWGGVAAFTSTLVQIGGPPYFAFTLPQRMEKMLFVGTTIWFFALVNVMKVAPYFALGQFSTSRARDLGGADPARGGQQHGRRLAGARHAGGNVLQDHQSAGASDRHHPDLAGPDAVAVLSGPNRKSPASLPGTFAEID